MDSKAVISTRIRLARNIVGQPFEQKIDKVKAADIINGVYSSIAKMDNFSIHRMNQLSDIDAMTLIEKHLISTDLYRNKESGAAIINDAETVSVLVNEEDHIREQCILKGFNLEKAYKIVNEVDDNISKRYDFSFNHKLGYLTACPTNIGTGMRASAMMFLPGLSIYKSLEGVISAITRLNMTIRGVYGEGSDSSGYIFQVSNQRTLGVKEQEILDAVQMSIGHINDAELKARDLLKENKGSELKDKIYRAYGILTTAYKLDIAEFMQLISLIKLGNYYGYVSVLNDARLDKLIENSQQASILAMSGKELSMEESNVYRAHFVSKNLKTFVRISN